MKATRILLAFGIGSLLTVFIVGIYVVPKLQAGSPKTTRQSDASRVPVSDVYVDVTYATPEFIERVKLQPYLQKYQGRGQPFLIGINTHFGTIANLDLRGKALLEDDAGNSYPSLGKPVVLSEHHNLYLLVFPLLDHQGKPIFTPNRHHFRLIVRGVGQTAERVFTWKLPVVEPQPVKTIANTLMLALGIVGALMVILSPCAIELTTYYTGIIAGIVSSAALVEKGAKLPIALRQRIIQNLAAFVAGFTILYMASGATVAYLGQQLIALQQHFTGAADDPFCGNTIPGASNAANNLPMPSVPHAHPGLFGAWGHYANWVGAAFLIYFALKSVGLFRQNNRCFVWLAQGGRKFRSGIAALVSVFSAAKADVIRRPAATMRKAGNITPANSFCAGLGLSVSCLTCMGGAILYPLLIFVGTSTWYWGALILGTYSLALAIPMAAIAVAVGNFTWQFVHRPRLTRSLQWTSATVMLLVAMLVLFDRTRFINTVVFSVLSAVGGQPRPALF